MVGLLSCAAAIASAGADARTSARGEEGGTAVNDGEQRRLRSARQGPGHHPDLQRGREHQADRLRGSAPRCPTPTSSSPTTTAPTAPASSPTSWPPPTTRCTCCTARGKEGLGAAYLAGFRLGHRARLRRAGRDGRRRLAPARGTAAAAHRAQGRRPGPRLALDPRRPGGQLAEVPRVPLPRRQHLLAAAARRADPRRHRRLPGLPHGDPAGPGHGGGRLGRATASRSTSPGARSRPASTSSRCRSPSSSASAATAR